MLALSRRCETVLRKLALPDLLVLSLEELERREPRLLQAKANRKTVEYFFTLTPWVIKHALDEVPEAKRATYLDSDLYFFDSPDAIWEEIGEAPMTFVEHRFSKDMQKEFGKFNVGWNTFDRSHVAQKSPELVVERCIEWCHDYIDGEKFADQGYLTTLEKEFKESMHEIPRCKPC